MLPPAILTFLSDPPGSWFYYFGLLAALEARDGTRAGKLILRHVRKTGQVVRESLDDPIKPAGAAAG